MENLTLKKIKDDYLLLLQKLGQQREKIKKNIYASSAKTHKFRVYVTTQNYVTLPVVVQAFDCGSAQLLAKSMYPAARSVGSAIKIL